MVSWFRSWPSVRISSIRHFCHARQQQAIDIHAGRQVAEALQCCDQRLEPRHRNLAGRLEEFPLVIEIIGLLDLVGLEARDRGQQRDGFGAVPIVLEPGAAASLGQLSLPDSGDLLVVVGPEGGITEQESAAFRQAGAGACSLGPTVLRTSTAGTVAAAVLLSHSARWS